MNKLRELYAKATTGEWYVDTRGPGVVIRDPDDTPLIEMWINGKPHVLPDAALIVAMHSALPVLLDALDAAKAARGYGSFADAWYAFDTALAKLP